MASTPVDPLQTLSAALAVPADSREQAELLASLRASLEAHPAPIPVLCTTLIPTIAHAADSLLRRWVLDLLHFAICRSSLAVEQRTNLSLQSVDVLVNILGELNPVTVKVATQTFTTVYPLLFRHLCVNRQPRQLWETLTNAKTRILEFIWAPAAPLGVKLAAMKFAQRAIVVQTRGVSDPRLQKKEDPNISLCPTDHPFISVAQLEAEGLKLLESVITLLYTSQNVDLLTAMLNSWGQLAKLRPGLTQLVVSTLTAWTPAALQSLDATSIKSVEKAVRILMIHLSRTPVAAPYVQQLNEALAQQGYRMDKAAMEEKARRAAPKRTAVAGPSSDATPDAKRPKVDHPPASASFLASFDFTSLPGSMVTEFIVNSIGALSESQLTDLVNAYKRSRPTETAGIPAIPATPAPTPAATAAGPSRPPPTAPVAMVKARSQSNEPVSVPVKDEPADPLAMNIDNDEMDYEPDRLNQELSGEEPADEAEEPMDITTLGIDLTDFKLPPPKTLEDPERDVLVDKAVARLWMDAGDPPPTTSRDPVEGTGSPDLWMLLLVRMVTRAAPLAERDESPKEGDEKDEDDGPEARQLELYARQDRLRQVICDYIMADFPSRLRLAITWMNEEWYNDRVRMTQDSTWRPNYETWLNQFVSTYQTQLDHKDKTFSRFLLDIPLVPPDVIALLRELAVDPERREVGFTTLRGFVIQRPSLRQEALGALLDLTTHPDVKTRAAAINTVRRWVPGTQPMDDLVRGFALQMLRRLHAARQRPSEDGEGADIAEEPIDEDLAQTPYLSERVELPAQKQDILQHVELLFALSARVPEFLDEIFAAYGGMDSTVQDTLQELITPLVRSLGPNHGKLLTLLRTFPPGAESLALRILKIFTDHGRPSGTLVALVKSLISERDLDVRFLMPIIAELDKSEIVRHLPRIISTLNGTPENKTLVKSVFGSIISTPAQTFGTVTSNLPRVRQSELLTPAELMVLLHDSEKDIGLKSTIEAIGICFSMTDVYKPEVLGAVMQQIVDEPTLPTLFLRTVIQAVTTYRSLVSFVSTTLFNRLIIKKVWANPPLWEGFIRCAKIIAPASYAALLQLPKDQLRDVVDKQPSLKSGLREHIMKTARNKARMPGFMDIFGGEEEGKTPTPATPVETPAGTPAPTS